MPHLVEMDRRYGKKGLQIVGVHCQQATDEELKELIKEHRVKFPISTGGKVPGEGRGIPRMVVFDPSGKMVYNGHPMAKEADKIIKKQIRALKKAGGPPSASSKEAESSEPEAIISDYSFTNADGRSLPKKASLLSVVDGIGTFEFTDGKKFSFEIAKLSEADQRMISEKMAAE